MRTLILAIAIVSMSICGCRNCCDHPSRAYRYDEPVIVSPSVPITVPVGK